MTGSEASLHGRTVVVTRPESEDGPLADALRSLGARPVHRPVLGVRSTGLALGLRSALAPPHTPDWLLLTSPRAVAVLADSGVFEQAVPPGLRVAVAGDRTAEAVRRRGWPVDVVPEPAGAAELLLAMGEAQVGSGDRILFAASSRARPQLAEGLEAMGADVETVPIYGPVARPLDLAEWAHPEGSTPWDALTFTSPSAVEALEGALPHAVLEALRRLPAGVQGPTTGAAARDAGWPLVVEARPRTFRGLAQSLAEQLGPKDLPTS